VIKTVESLMQPDDTLELVDVTLHPERAEADRVLATPTLLKLEPMPRQRVIGEVLDASALGRVLGRSGEAGS
jgi:circadian clock protein KaiB